MRNFLFSTDGGSYIARYDDEDWEILDFYKARSVYDSYPYYDVFYNMLVKRRFNKSD